MKHTRLTILATCTLLLIAPFARADNPNHNTSTIRWGVPLEYRTQTDQVSNTEVLPRRNRPAASAPELPDNPTPEDIAQTEERLNNEVRILWDEIEKAEKQQQQATDIQVLPLDKNKPDPTKNTSKTPTTNNKITPKTKPNTPANIKTEKERIDALLRNPKDKNSKISTTPPPKNPPEIKVETKTPPQSKTTRPNRNTNNNTNTSKPKTPSTTAPVVALPTPTPKPVLTRKQVLEEEIAREKAALKSAKTQLSIARKRGNAAQIQKLNAMIKDRELNVQAISRELSR